jgi:hypothetical protein
VDIDVTSVDARTTNVAFRLVKLVEPEFGPGILSGFEAVGHRQIGHGDDPIEVDQLFRHLGAAPPTSQAEAISHHTRSNGPLPGWHQCGGRSPIQ